VQDYHRLDVWRRAHRLALDVYHATDRVNDRKASGLVSQLRRAALSISANIAEGAGRGSDRDFARFIQIAIGSTTELELHLEFGGDSRIIDSRISIALRRDSSRVRRMLVGLLKRLRATEQNHHPVAVEARADSRKPRAGKPTA